MYCKECPEYYYTRSVSSRVARFNEILTLLDSIEVAKSVLVDYRISLQVLRNSLSDMRHDLIVDAYDRAFFSHRAWNEYVNMRRLVDKLHKYDSTYYACRALMHSFEAAAYAVADSPDFAPAYQVALTFARKAVAEKEKANA